MVNGSDAGASGEESPRQLAPLAKAAPNAYKRKLPHLQVAGRTIFVTFVTWQRRILPEHVRQLVLDRCLHEHESQYYLHAAVVMSDHVHLLLTPLDDEMGNTYPLRQIMSGIKGSSAHAVNRALKWRGSVWQPESFDHVLRNDESARSKAEYICQNPVRAGIVDDESTYPYRWQAWLQRGGSPTISKV